MVSEILTIITNLIGKCLEFIVGPVLSVVGFCLTIKGMRAQKQSNTIDWSQMHSAAKTLCKNIKKFKPNVIICPGQKGGIFAQLIVDNLELKIPIYTGFIVSVSDTIDSSLTENYFNIDTTKWHVFLPLSIKNTINCKVLIVDDYVMSGDFLFKLKKTLIEYGYGDDKVKSCSIVTTNVAKLANKAPDYYWKIVDAEECYFPWGKAK